MALLFIAVIGIGHYSSAITVSISRVATLLDSRLCGNVVEKTRLAPKEGRDYRLATKNDNKLCIKTLALFS